MNLEQFENRKFISVESSYTKDDKGYFNCICICGNKFTSRSDSVRAGRTKSCGCYSKLIATQKATTHGYTKGNGKRTYDSWLSMKQRCTNTTRIDWHCYGGRGISFCDRWYFFENFLADMGEKPSKDYSLDRINVDGNYEPSNCRWATRLEQSNNTRSCKWIEFNGERLTQSGWAKRIGAKNPTAIRDRLRMGWTIEKSLTTPMAISFTQKAQILKDLTNKKEEL